MENRMKHPHMLTRLLPILVCAVAAGGLLFAVQPVSAVDSGPTISPAYCMQSIFSGQTAEPIPNSVKLNCTAGDIRLSRAISVNPATCTAGTKFTLTATFETIVTANARYDAGFYFNISGGANARLGDSECSLSVLTPVTGGPPLNLDGDTCGDLNAGTYNLTFTIPDVLCNDSDGDGFLNLPNCTSWHSNSSTICQTTTADDPYGTLAENADPDTKSKCVCDDKFQVPVVVEHPNISVEKVASPTEFYEPGGTVTYKVTVHNPAEVASVTITKITEDDVKGTGIDATYTNISEMCGSATLAPCGPNPNNCAANSTTTCTFTRTVSGNASQSFVDEACVSGTDSNGGAVGPTCATATVAIKDVLPTASVVKSVLGLVECPVIEYQVKVDNADSAEPLTLSKLVDDKFGDITSVQGKVVSTTCSTTTIAASGSYTCKFKAKTCSETDTVTATLSDNDGNTITPSGWAGVTVRWSSP